MRRTIAVGLLVGLACSALVAFAPSVAASGTWTWPLRGPVVRPYDEPASPYGAGHRGIDIAVPAGTTVVAPASGVVSFAGRVAGQLFVSVDHGAGLVSTASYLSVATVTRGDPVVAGQALGRSGAGHPGGDTPHLHFGVRLGGVYVDPLDYLAPLSLVGILWLAPIGSPAAGPAAPTAAPAVRGPWWGGEREPIAPVGGTRPSPVRGRPIPA